MTLSLEHLPLGGGFSSAEELKDTVSPLHTNKFYSERAFVCPICKSNKVSLGTQLTQLAT